MLNRLDKNDVMFLTIAIIVFIAFVGGMFGNDFAAEVFTRTWVALPVAWNR